MVGVVDLFPQKVNGGNVLRKKIKSKGRVV
jgi:hypothetical protein